MISAPFIVRKWELTFWNRWRTPRIEHLADGTTALYFGMGRMTWR